MTETEEHPSEGLVKVGEILKHAREQKKLSLDQIARITRINIHVLEEIENGELKHNPGAVFVRGFIRTYSELVGVSNKEFLEYLSNIPELNEKASYYSQALAPISNKTEIFSFKYLYLTILIILGGGYYAFNDWSYIESLFTGDTNSEKESSILKEDEQQQKSLPVEKTTSNKLKSLNKVSSKTAAPKKGKIVTKVEITTTTMISTTIPITTTTEPQPLFSGILNLKVKAIGSTWLTIAKDREASVDVLLQEGDEYSLEANDHFLLTVGNTHGVELFLNGKSLSINQESQLLENWLLDKSILEVQ